jgi:hypothetical protein
MSEFARIRPVISHYEEFAREAHGPGFVAEARKHFDDMQKKYYSSVENPDYSPSMKKFCYLYKYSVAHGYYIYALSEAAAS